MKQSSFQRSTCRRRQWLAATAAIVVVATIFCRHPRSTTLTSTSSSTTASDDRRTVVGPLFLVDARPVVSQSGGIHKLATIVGQQFQNLDQRDAKQQHRRYEDSSSLTTTPSSSSHFSKWPSSPPTHTSHHVVDSIDSSVSLLPRTFFSRSRRSAAATSKPQSSSFSMASLQPTSRLLASKEKTTTKNTSIGSEMQQDFRGGAAAASHLVKTMTARRMETLKFLSGGVAGTVAACITNPLEVIKTQLQSSNRELLKARGHPVQIAQTIMEQDGVSGFFRGLPPTLVGIIPSRSAYFYAYQRIKSFLDPTLPEGSPPNALIAGFMAGIVGNTLTNPIWMVRTRMQLLIDHTAGQRQYAGYKDAIVTIFREEGLGGFYKGITASYWGCAEGALQFIIYEQLKARLLERQNARRRTQGLRPSSELPKATYFWAAAASKGVAAVATYPHEVARTRMREQARSGVFKYQQGMWKTIGVMAKEEGVKSLYSGMGVHLMKVVPNSALMFLTYEVVRSWLDEYQIVER